MIFPRSRLLFWFGAVVVPFAALASVMPSSTVMSGTVISVFIFVVSLDAAFSLRRLDGVSLEFPGVVRLSKGCEGALELTVRKEGEGAARFRLGLAFPREVLPRHEELSLDLPRGSSTSSHLWPCTPLKRGRYFFRRCYLEHASYLGFWAKRSAVPAGFEMRVYPNLSNERRKLASIFLNRGNFGIHAQRHVGQGRDFEKLREYVHGDSYDSIHWKATAKRGRPITKVFQIERTQEVYVIVDASRLSARQSGPAVKTPGPGRGNGPEQDTILERYITAALVMGAAAERQGDRYGILTFSNRVHRFLRANSGKAHYDSCRDALYELDPTIVTPDFDDLSTFISLRLRKRALLVFLTNLDDPVLAEGFVRNTGLLCRRHLVLAGMIKPPGARPMFSDSKVDSLDGIYESLGGHMLWHGLRELDKVLKRKGAGFILLEGEKACSQLVSQYLSVKERQLL
jgi:uncharacterized protein (DUF58 family)